MRTSKLQLAVWCVAALATSGCHRLPSDEGLAGVFAAHRMDFERLLKMTGTDAACRRISAGGVSPEGMSENRYREYLAAFQKLGISNGIAQFSAYPQAVFAIADSDVPFAGKSRAEGYVHSSVPLRPLVRELPRPRSPLEFHRGEGQETAFRRLEDGWYLFYMAEW